MNKRPRKTQETFNQEVYNLVNDEYVVTGTYITNKQHIEMMHKTCGQKFNVTPNNFLRGSRCPYCYGTKFILKGYNDMATTSPFLVDLLYDKNDAYKYRSNSNIKIKWKCPNCSNILVYSPFVVNTYGLRCHNCSDGISYPNKFIHSFFNQLSKEITNYQTEYSPEWIGMKRYDVYFEINDLKYIVEVDGGLGHRNIGYNNDKTYIQKSISVDKYKELEAIKHNIIVIRIDAIKSTLQYIRHSILNSKLNDIFDLSKIDWIKCHIDATTSKRKDVIKLYNSGIKNLKDIVSITKNISYTTVYRYLLEASKCGLCDYNPKLYINYRKPITHICKKVICLNTLKIYDSITQASIDNNNIAISGISQCCNGKQKTCGKSNIGEKLKWQFYEDYILEVSA